MPKCFFSFDNCVLSRLVASATKRLWWVSVAAASRRESFGPFRFQRFSGFPLRTRSSQARCLRVARVDHLARLQEAGASPPILSLLPRKTSSGHRLVGDLHPASARVARAEWCWGPGRALARPWHCSLPAQGPGAAGHALSLKPLFDLCTTLCLPLLKIGGLAPNKPSTAPHKSSGLSHT